MAKKGKRGGFKTRTRTRTIVKYRTRAVKVARRAKHHAAGLAKERAPVAFAGAVLGWADVKRGMAQSTAAGAPKDQFGSLLQSIPEFGGASWLGTFGAALHFYHKSNPSSRWADRFSTAALTLAGYKLGRQQASKTAADDINPVKGVAGNGGGGGVWIEGR